ncbi:enoyl-CoA hydratase [Aciditerrimonas ferrireducens]|uniref:Enoyl-CoA hydratase n=1 Tax=Aciditerrimonas ferrireducens TaxID=667306 RepID=A0ABV6C8Z7_9ACTN
MAEPATLPSSPVVRVEREGPVALVTLWRPEARNALNAELRRDLPRVLAALDADGEIGAIVLTGADPAFCAGLDLKELGAGQHRLGQTLGAGARRLGSGPVPDLQTPLIGAVNGPAVTGGLELALHCDLLLASERARFADTHARVGVQPGWGLTVLLAEAVGRRRALEMSMTGRFVDAQRALAWGLVNAVVPHEELLPSALALAREIAEVPRASLRRLRATYRRQWAVADGAGLQLEAEVAAAWAQGPEASPEAVEARREALVARGRAQAASGSGVEGVAEGGRAGSRAE